MPTTKLHNESLLVDAMRAGNQEAFTLLYQHYSPLLYSNMLRMVHDPIATEELVQELFTRIWQNRESKGIKENFTGYMYRIAQNLVYDFFRRLKKDHVLMTKFRAIIEEEVDATVEDRLQQQQAAGIINNAIEHLPPQQKKVYRLVKQEGYTYKKAAEDMGISPFTVKEYLVLAHKSIRSYLVAHQGELMSLILITLSFSFSFSFSF